MKEILVSTLMTTEVTCLTPDVPLREAISQMVDNLFSCIIIKQGNIPLGIITERDLVKVLNKDQQNQDLDMPVSEFMSSPILRLNQNESLFDALVVVRAEKVRHLPVVNDADELVGLVTQSDLANAHFHVTELQSEMIEKAIANKTVDLQMVNEELQALSMEDHLMEIGNRRAMEVDLDHTHASAIRYRQHYSILLVDVDTFKLYNDHYGHQMGDDVLKQVARVLKKSIRSSDRIYRYGGEELLLILPNTNAQQSRIAGQKLVDLVAGEVIPHVESSYNYLTISIGSCCVLPDQIDSSKPWNDFIELADQALYEAKEGGRNRIEVAQPEVKPESESAAV